MNLPPPKRGDVIRYAYLWADEYRRGREEASKDRPAIVLAIAVRQSDGQIQILALAITHTPPKDPLDAVPLPQAVKRRLGLDQEQSWIVTTEANAFIWPGPDLRPIPDRDPPSVIYGRLPDKLLQAVAHSYLQNRQRQISSMVPRTS